MHLNISLNTATECCTLWSTKWFYCRHAGSKVRTQECITQCKKFKRLSVQKHSTHAKVSNKEAGKHTEKNQAVIQRQRVGLSKDSRQKNTASWQAEGLSGNTQKYAGTYRGTIEPNDWRRTSSSFNGVVCMYVYVATYCTGVCRIHKAENMGKRGHTYIYDRKGEAIRHRWNTLQRVQVQVITHPVKIKQEVQNTNT